MQALASSTPSNACNFVPPADATACKPLVSTAVLKLSGFGVGKTFTDGNRAIVTLLASSACIGIGSAPTTTSCFNNSNQSTGLPTSNAGFDAAYTAAASSSIDAAIDCVQVSGNWYVSFEAAAGVGTTGTPSGSSVPAGSSGSSTTTPAASSGSSGTSTTAGSSGTPAT